MLIPAIAAGQLTVPPESEQYVPIPVTLKAMVPDGAQIKSGPGLVWPEGVNKIEVAPGQWVVCAPPGEYTITYKVSWLHIVPITFKDFDGKEVTFQNYLGSGDVDEKATFKIKGEVKPEPKPEPGPGPTPPPGDRTAVILEESKDRTGAQAAMYDDLRQKFPKLKVQLLDDDQDQAQKYLHLVPANVRPALVVLQSDQVVRALACPAKADEVAAEVAR